MTYLSGERSLFPGNSRLFEPLYTAALLIDSLLLSAKAIAGLPLPKLGDRATLLCNQFPLEVWLPVFGPMYAEVKNRPVAGMGVQFKPRGTTQFAGRAMSDGLGNLQLNIVALIFLKFYEAHAPWLAMKFGKDTKTWPQLFQFAWVVRNSFVHHAGKLSFKNPNYSCVQWHALAYKPSDNGRQILGSDLGFGDILVLMFECSDELDRLGCPASP